MRSQGQATDQSALFDEAADLQQRGALAEAAARYRTIIHNDPRHMEALYQLAWVCCRQGQLAEGVDLARRAIAEEPRRARWHVLLGRALAELGEMRDALASFDRAIAYENSHAEVYCDRGVVLTQLGRVGEAIESYRRAIALQPEVPTHWCSVGAAQSELEDYEEALASFDRALALAPNYAEAHVGRATALIRLQRADAARANLEQALAIAPDHVAALVSYGDLLRTFGRRDEALASYDRALALAPNEVLALIGRAIVLETLQRPEEALASLDHALTMVPPDANSLSMRGHLLRLLRRHDEALATLNHALEIEPDHAEALGDRGSVLLDLGRPSDAIHSYRRALAIAPRPEVHSRLIAALNFDPDVSAADQRAERLQWNEQHARVFAADILPHRNVPNHHRRLRVGYIGSAFNHQATTYTFASAIVHRDVERFEVVCYANDADQDAITGQLRASADTWRQIDGWSDASIANCIRGDGIDILVDLAGHSGGQRLLVFARKPAPIQVTGWGDPIGTGIASMDYVFVDPVLTPADQRTFLVEKPYELPSALGYWMPEPLPDLSQLPAMSRGYVTFGSFNRIAKIQDPVVRSWAAILRAVPNARLLIQSELEFDDGGRRLDIEDVFADEGVNASRIRFCGLRGRTEDLAKYGEVDIALDPFPYSDGETTLDALSMGVPVITLAGRTISSRLAASSLTTLGLTDFVTTQRRDYVDVAVGMARDVTALAYLRVSLRSLLASSIIGDPVRYARSVEAAYCAMWRDWCAGAARR